ncbi:unnamed protein product [Enterobius vermicularis]|uniref:non-specific serine/threonine protein kinase n=1 Tax=Enterobius vermicularis TaxID=51028 RepID=A0A0N4VLA2_ENTVE|nr:unnamed protein product [Enterobius vermicularis]
MATSELLQSAEDKDDYTLYDTALCDDFFEEDFADETGVYFIFLDDCLRGIFEEKFQGLGENKMGRVKDRADRATVEQVLDPRTRLILFRLLQRNIFASIDGCINTGKEANVYHALCSDGYRHGYCRRNPRKMVATWAEKEMRNLSRMHQAGLAVPKPILLKGHVLVMEFLGDDGWPAPLLKTADLEMPLLEKIYLDLVVLMRKMYRSCRLVHADLSEYNLIVPVLSLYNLFKVIADPGVADEAKFEELLNKRSLDNSEDDALFMNAYIAHKLEHVLYFERDEEIRKEGGEVPNPFQTMLAKIEHRSSSETGEEEESPSEEAASTCMKQSGPPREGVTNESCKKKKVTNFVRDRNESPESKKRRKQLVKEERRENRLTKTPKHIKKRHDKVGKHR